MIATFPPLPHRMHSEWIANGYLWRPYTCPVKGCGLQVIDYHWPNDPSYNVDPVTCQPHAAVCCDPERVAAMYRAADAKRKAALDGKSAAAGDKQ